MIVPMKKVFVIVRSQDADAAAKDLRSLGVLHVEHQVVVQSKTIEALQEDLTLVNSCSDVFVQAKALPKASGADVRLTVLDWKSQASHIVDLWKRYEQLEIFGTRLFNSISQWEPWGDFQPQDIQELKQKGIYVKFYLVPKKQLAEFPKDVAVKKVFQDKGVIGCVAVANRDFESPFKDLPLPHNGLAAMKERFTEDRKVMDALKAQIQKAHLFYTELSEIKKRLEKEIEFHAALAGMATEDSLGYFVGYIPFDATERLAQEAKEKKWGLLISDPSGTDNVPTLIHNPRWISVIMPVFKMLEVVPGYRELDISPLFLIFLSLFFGILIGDAGYGSVYMLLTFWFHKRRRGKIKDVSVLYLFYILSFCAIVWGLLTGTFFGQGWLSGMGYKPLLPSLKNPKTIQAFCFFLGAFHLSLAHGWRALLKFPSMTALADIGWISTLWAAFLLAKTLILGDPFPAIGQWLIMIGIMLVVLFISPDKNIIKGIASGVGNLALSLMNNFTDVVSYVRLFAVGLAGVAIADAFNAMATEAARTGGVAVALSVLIIIAGHGLNLLLGPMSVLVHGIRLNVLEFCGHADVKWSGTAYKPLKE